MFLEYDYYCYEAQQNIEQLLFTYQRDKDYGFYEHGSITYDCNQCQKFCDIDPNCGAVECDISSNLYCLWWKTGKFSVIDSPTVEYKRTCQKVATSSTLNNNNVLLSIGSRTSMLFLDLNFILHRLCLFKNKTESVRFWKPTV